MKTSLLNSLAAKLALSFVSLAAVSSSLALSQELKCIQVPANPAAKASGIPSMLEYSLIIVNGPTFGRTSQFNYGIIGQSASGISTYKGSTYADMSLDGELSTLYILNNDAESTITLTSKFESIGSEGEYKTSYAATRKTLTETKDFTCAPLK